MPGPVALLTDFGAETAYVAAMKGVILSIAPSATVVDLAHDVPAHDVVAGAFLLERTARFFPRGTIFVGVVDPGVGTRRAPICLRAGGCLFVGPDNGLLAPAAAARGRPTGWRLARRRWFLPDVSTTFHGRDVFAPVAAHLARGLDPRRLGPSLGGWERSPVPSPRRRGGAARGEVVLVDRFGNLVTNLARRDVPAGPVRIEIAGAVVTRVARTFAEAPDRTPVALWGSFERLEIACNGESAARRLGAGRATAVHVLPDLPPRPAARSG